MEDIKEKAENYRHVRDEEQKRVQDMLDKWAESTKTVKDINKNFEDILGFSIKFGDNAFYDNGNPIILCEVGYKDLLYIKSSIIGCIEDAREFLTTATPAATEV